jgi:hypothetical protein
VCNVLSSGEEFVVIGLGGLSVVMTKVIMEDQLHTIYYGIALFENLNL